jgi:hypothetical protein
MIAKELQHNYLLRQMVPVMHIVATVATSRFRYSALLIHWADAELDMLQAKWLQVHRAAAWRLPLSFPSEPLMLPSADWGCLVAHPVMPIVLALVKQFEQLVVLPDPIQRRERSS